MSRRRKTRLLTRHQLRTQRRKEKRKMSDPLLRERRMAEPMFEPEQHQPMRFSGTDQHGKRFNILTLRRPSEHPGYATLITHQAFSGGETIMVSVCVTWTRAIAMHEHWMDVFVVGPLPDVIQEVGMGIWKGDCKMFHPKAQRYKGGQECGMGNNSPR